MARRRCTCIMRRRRAKQAAAAAAVASSARWSNKGSGGSRPSMSGTWETSQDGAAGVPGCGFFLVSRLWIAEAAVIETHQPYADMPPLTPPQPKRPSYPTHTHPPDGNVFLCCCWNIKVRADPFQLILWHIWVKFAKVGDSKCLVKVAAACRTTPLSLIGHMDIKGVRLPTVDWTLQKGRLTSIYKWKTMNCGCLLWIITPKASQKPSFSPSARGGHFGSVRSALPVAPPSNPPTALKSGLLVPEQSYGTSSSGEAEGDVACTWCDLERPNWQKKWPKKNPNLPVNDVILLPKVMQSFNELQTFSNSGKLYCCMYCVFC